MNDILEKEYEQMKSIINDPLERETCLNFKGFDGKVELEELYELMRFIHKDEYLQKYIGGSSYEGNGVNFNFTWNGKPYLMRIEIDDFHYQYWKDIKYGFWEE